MLEIFQVVFSFQSIQCKFIFLLEEQDENRVSLNIFLLFSGIYNNFVCNTVHGIVSLKLTHFRP